MRLIKQNRQAGFSMLEVLIALLVIAFGFLGVAKMLALAMGDSTISGSRAIAAIYASSLASAMRANEAYWASGNAPSTAFTVNGTTISDAGLTSNQTTNCNTTVCSPAQLAAFDLASTQDSSTWGPSLASQLPGGYGTIQCSSGVGAPVTCTITVTWNEHYIKLNNLQASATGQSFTTASLQLVVNP